MLRQRILMTLGLCIVIWMVGAWVVEVAQPVVAQTQPSQAVTALEVSPVMTTLIDLHNQQRAAAGLPLLTIEPSLMQAAQMHALYMAEHQKTTHQGPHGTTPAQRLKQQGYNALQIAENVASGQETPEAVMQGWMHSPPHRHNILGHFSEIGAARATGVDGKLYWCVVFGLPMP